jgi:hypothetical protein
MLYFAVYFKEIGCSGMDWIYLAQDRGQWRANVNMEINLRVPENVEKFWSSFTAGSFLNTLTAWS